MRELGGKPARPCVRSGYGSCLPNGMTTRRLDTPEPPEAPRGDRRRAGKRMSLGIGTIAVGIAAIVVANEIKLTATKALLGGYYLKEPYRVAFLLAGVMLAILGILLAALSALRTAEPMAVEALSRVTLLLLAATLVWGGVIYSGYHHAEQNREEQTKPSQPPESSRASNETETRTSPGSSPTSIETPCGTAPGPGGTFGISATENVSCEEAQAVFRELVAVERTGPKGSQTADPQIQVNGWTCSGGAGGFGCTGVEGHEGRITANWLNPAENECLKQNDCP